MIVEIEPLVVGCSVGVGTASVVSSSSVISAVVTSGGGESPFEITLEVVDVGLVVVGTRVSVVL